MNQYSNMNKSTRLLSTILAGVRFELHVLGTGGHGFGLRGRDPRLQIWAQLAVNWLTTCDFPPAPPPAVPPN